ncbi:hypothetical protein AB0C76_27345 [Kitasatospora sp. NPDC048722]|uniref:hypothetical protein n=1 Tax=Kitasatospora sp. NPDC048722 TaxID=3155639 RepID=UPI0033E2F3A9
MGSKGTYDIVSTSGHAWLKPDATFRKTIAGPKGDVAAELFKGRWLTGPADDQNLKSSSSLCDIAGMGAQTADGSDTKGDRTTENGKPALVLHVTDGDGSKTDVWVSAQGKPYPLKSVSDDRSTIIFTDYGVPVAVTPPPADSVVDTAKLKQATGA